MVDMYSNICLVFFIGLHQMNRNSTNQTAFTPNRKQHKGCIRIFFTNEQLNWLSKKIVHVTAFLRRPHLIWNGWNWNYTYNLRENTSCKFEFADDLWLVLSCYLLFLWEIVAKKTFPYCDFTWHSFNIFIPKIMYNNRWWCILSTVYTNTSCLAILLHIESV